MNTHTRATARGFLAAGLTCIAAMLSAQGAEGDRDALAQKVVASAGVVEGDLITISGGVRDAELLENLAVHVRKAGAHPVVTLGSDRMGKLMFEKVAAKYDSQAPAFDLKLAETMTVQISVDTNEDPGAFAGIPAARRAAVGKTFEPVGRLMQKRNVRQVFLGNGLYPTKKAAESYGLSQEALAKLFWDGVNVDYGKLQATAESVKRVLAAGKEVHITSPAGTDLKLRIEARPVFVSDGVISPEEARKGGAACQVWLPAGEVYVTPVPGTAEGKVVVPSQAFEGKQIAHLTLTYKAGKLTAMAASSGLEPLQAVYDAAGPGKDLLGALDFGINPNVTVPPGSRLATWVPAGMVSLQLGNNLWAGGDNSLAFGLGSFLPGTTVKVDGQTIVENGVLKF